MVYMASGAMPWSLVYGCVNVEVCDRVEGGCYDLLDIQVKVTHYDYILLLRVKRGGELLQYCIHRLRIILFDSVTFKWW